MTEIQDLLSLLPFVFKAWMDTLPFEDKAIFEVLRSWSQRFIYFGDKARISLTDEERRSVEEEKQLFFNEIGLDECTFNYMFRHGFPFFTSIANTSTDEEGTKTAFVTALAKCVREKIQKSISPAA